MMRSLSGQGTLNRFTAEPWHIRYVGDPEVAAEIAERGITLEEYCEMR